MKKTLITVASLAAIGIGVITAHDFCLIGSAKQAVDRAYLEIDGPPTKTMMTALERDADTLAKYADSVWCFGREKIGNAASEIAGHTGTLSAMIESLKTYKEAGLDDLCESALLDYEAEQRNVIRRLDYIRRSM